MTIVSLIIFGLIALLVATILGILCSIVGCTISVHKEKE
jgi:hypothetical protein